MDDRRRHHVDRGGEACQIQAAFDAVGDAVGRLIRGRRGRTGESRCPRAHGDGEDQFLDRISIEVAVFRQHEDLAVVRAAERIAIEGELTEVVAAVLVRVGVLGGSVEEPGRPVRPLEAAQVS